MNSLMEQKRKKMEMILIKTRHKERSHQEPNALLDQSQHDKKCRSSRS